MRKIFVIFLSLFYLVLSSGFTQYVHACKEMAVKTYSLTNTAHQNADNPCPICSSKEKHLTQKKKDCCQYEVKTVQVDDGVKLQTKIDQAVKFLGDAIPYETLGTVFDFSILRDTTKQSTNYLSSKVPVRGNPLYILHCVYRI